MAAQKPRSGLSDAFKALHARGNGACAASSAAVPEPTRRLGSPAASKRSFTSHGSAKDMPYSSDAAHELQQILSQAQQSTRSSVFGCSPPVRADNPLVHDSIFSRGSKAEQSCGAFCSVYSKSVGFNSSPASALSTA